MTYQERQSTRHERITARAERAERLAEARERAARVTADGIPLGQPMLVGHHSYKADRNRRERMQRNFEKAHELREYAKSLRQRAGAIGTAGIASDDPDAPEQIRARIAELSAKRDLAKDINALFRKGNAAKLLEVYGLDLAKLREQVASGYSFLGRSPYPAYHFSNLGANIKRLESRLANLEHMAEADDIDETGNGWRVYTEDGRVCLDHADRLPRNHSLRGLMGGFVWSRTNDRWQRKLTPNAMAHVHRVLLPALREGDATAPPEPDPFHESAEGGAAGFRFGGFINNPDNGGGH